MTTIDTAKAQSLKTALADIEKNFGKGSILRLGENTNDAPLPVISSGSLGVDLALGIGGLPRGRIIEVYGPESSGKTTLALHAIAEAQRTGGTCAFVDAEHALDVTYARKLGVVTEDLLISQPDHGEQALEITDRLVCSNAVDVIVVDSVAALVPKAELEGDMGDSHVGLQARLMSQALRKLTGSVARTGAVVIFINQLRMKIGVMFGSPETTTGGNALKFYASVRIDVRRIGALKDGDNVVGNRTRVKVVKNKMAPPFREAELDINYGRGFSRVGEIVDLGVEAGIIEKSGSWLSYNRDRLGQGRDSAIKLLTDQPRLAEEIAGRIMAAAGVRPRVVGEIATVAAVATKATPAPTPAAQAANAAASASAPVAAGRGADAAIPSAKSASPAAAPAPADKTPGKPQQGPTKPGAVAA